MAITVNIRYWNELKHKPLEKNNGIQISPGDYPIQFSIFLSAIKIIAIQKIAVVPPSQ